jgi:hypothetical protein
MKMPVGLPRPPWKNDPAANLARKPNAAHDNGDGDIGGGSVVGRSIEIEALMFSQAEDPRIDRGCGPSKD